jgi:hypothetical protein
MKALVLGMTSALAGRLVDVKLFKLRKLAIAPCALPTA